MKASVVVTFACLLALLPATAHAHPVKTNAAAEAWARTPFARCVRWRESRDGAAAANLYEIQGPHASGNYGDYHWLDGTSRAQQDLIAYLMFRARGDSPWRPYDGCSWP